MIKTRPTEINLKVESYEQWIDHSKPVTITLSQGDRSVAYEAHVTEQSIERPRIKIDHYRTEYAAPIMTSYLHGGPKQ